MNDSQIESWAQKETDKHFEHYWEHIDGTIIPLDKNGEMLADYLIEFTTYRCGLIAGAKSLQR